MIPHFVSHLLPKQIQDHLGRTPGEARSLASKAKLTAMRTIELEDKKNQFQFSYSQEWDLIKVSSLDWDKDSFPISETLWEEA